MHKTILLVIVIVYFVKGTLGFTAHRYIQFGIIHDIELHTQNYKYSS